ncbi:MAG: hypothetical protein ACI9KE_002397 [Polyangiales bacterium]|jgi:hypothetical protein
MMRPRRLLLVSCLLGLCLGLAGCGDDAEAPEEQGREEQELPEPRRHQAGTTNPHEAVPQRDALARVALGGERGRVFDSGAVILAGTSAVALDLREGARVSVEPGAEVRLLDEAPAQIAVAQGLVHVVLPPTGSSPRPPLRVGTPSGTLRLNGSGDAWALVFPDGRAWFAVTGGMAEVLVQREEGTESIGLHAGQALVAGADAPTAGPVGEAAARAAAAVLSNGAPEEAPSQEILDEVVVQLDAAIRSTREDYARGEALQRAHHEATESGDGHDALQAIVRFSQETQVRRDALLLVYERVRSLALRRGVTPDPGSVRRRDVRTALRRSDD